ncbi:spore gernimation protein GerB [Bacillus salipaludis]|uniref:GerAB/ArcD/ProY family transporter n=1 Tax=Bacillus salipaludis TaxID=2547811 RepID=A0A4R5VHG8_9BACI|nr:GerAB/ArcD/ProY family transporter [Bacillus salipaludis]MDQ6598961.1 GerAB/ArcD/ProY family transporter [Bacillus salipaludis]TDK54037.1 spore gernimation protein GerB [Bacillus salipaludis]
MEQIVPEKAKISSFLVFFLIHKMQVGIGVLGFQPIIALTAGYDAWIAVIISGLSIHMILWMMYKIAETADGDIMIAHTVTFGNKMGKFISLLFVIYFLVSAVTVLRNFIEVIQVWMFPDLSTFWYSLAFCCLGTYVVFGGIRTITGVAFFGFVLPAYLVFTFLFTLPYADFKNLLPIFDHSIKDLVKASYQMSFTYSGSLILLFFYPFIKEPKKSKKWAHVAVLLATIAYTFLTILTFAYFSEGQLQKNIWPTLTMWKIVEMPFVERFEYIGIATWTIVLLPNFCISFWCASRIIKKVTNLKQKYGVLMISMIVLIIINFLRTRQQINTVTSYLGKIGFLIDYGYIPLLFFLILIVKRVKKKYRTS